MSDHAVLGIDAAWTAGHPSGVALIANDAGAWRCVAVAPSYASFRALAAGRPVDWTRAPEGGPPPMAALREAARALLGYEPAVVAVDMPLSRRSITARRPADDAISRRYGAAKCSVHSPTPARPGPLATRIRRDLADRFALATATARPGDHPALLEVYPHVALLALTGARERLPYKIASSRRHSPGPPPERIRKIVREQGRILAALGRHIRDIPDELAAHAARATRLSALKRFEDAIDALVCAWVGARYLAGSAEAHGDADAAIWVPWLTVL